jgi:hypothetical protein
MKKTISSQGFKLAILGAALAVSGAALAVENAPQRAHERGSHHSAQHHGHHAHGGFHHAHAHGFHHGKDMRGHARMARIGMIVPGYGFISRDFVDGMGLKEEQLKLIEDARKAGKDLRETRKERFKTERAARAERFDAKTLDPEQALKQADERRAKAAAERRQVEEKWIAVWKSLDANQQARVADHLKDRAEKAQKRAEKMQARKQQREAAKAEQREERAEPAPMSS